MNAYAAKVKEIRAYLADQLARTDHTPESDEAAIRQINAFSREFVQCMSALPVETRDAADFKATASVVWQRLYEHENLFVLSQAYAAKEDDDVVFDIAKSLEKFKKMLVAQQMAVLSGATDEPRLKAFMHADARRARLLCIYLTARIQTDAARHLYGFSRVAELKKTVDELLGPLASDADIDMNAAAMADPELMRVLVDAIRHISRVYSQRFSEDAINDERSPRTGMRRVFFTNYIHLTEFKKQLAAISDILFGSDIDDGILETRVNESTMSAYRRFLRAIDLFLDEYRTLSRDDYFLTQQSMHATTTNVYTAAQLAICSKFKQLRTEVLFVMRETCDGQVFLHAQLTRDIQRKLLAPIDRALIALRCA